MDTLLIVLLYVTIIAIIFALVIAVGCLISPTFRKDFIADFKGE